MEGFVHNLAMECQLGKKQINHGGNAEETQMTRKIYRCVERGADK